MFLCEFSFFKRRRAYSSKTRIKTLSSQSSWKINSVGEHIPVKQGLRLLFVFPPTSTTYVGEHIPVKQGLRLRLQLLTRLFCLCRRAYSSKTRIKTHFYFQSVISLLSRRAYSSKTRIKTIELDKLYATAQLSASIFQ